MNDSDATVVRRPWSRPAPAATKPNRSFGGLYRSAEHEERAQTLGGVPLQSAEAAVVAAIRMGYRIADEQIDRGFRIASRLRGAASREGSDGLGDAMDGIEQLVKKLLHNGLQFVEEVARDPENPLKRLASTQFTLLGSLLGLNVTPKPNRPGDTGSDQQTESDATAPLAVERGGPTPQAVADAIRIQHRGDTPPRAVRVLNWHVRHDRGYHADVTFVDRDGRTMSATVEHVDGGPTLHVLVTDHRPGVWRAAVLDEHRMQLGYVEIEVL